MADPSFTHDELAAQLRQVVLEGEYDRLAEMLAPRVTWGDCVGPDAVVTTMRAMLQNGLAVDRMETEQLTDRLVVELVASVDGSTISAHQALFVTDGLVSSILDCGDADSARTCEPPGAVVADQGVRAEFASVAPVLPTANLDAAVEHYRALGFEVHHYEGDARYGFAHRGAVQLHLAESAGVDPVTTTSAAYLYVDDARALHAPWVNAGVPGRFREPEDTEYGLCEGAHIDPDGNLLRYGSPLA